MVNNFTKDDAEQAMEALINQNDRHAFGRIYDIYAPVLFGVIKRIVGDTKTSENILHKAFFEIWQNRKNYVPGKEKLFTWMLKTARKLALENIRCSQNVYSSENQYMNKSVYSKEAEDYLTGRNKTGGIEEIAKAALSLLYFKGCTFDEAAIKLNVSLDVLKTKVHEAIEKLNATVAA
jgi:DNA-directed RNA polymerase specialized sigma24 family protein